MTRRHLSGINCHYSESVLWLENNNPHDTTGRLIVFPLPHIRLTIRKTWSYQGLLFEAQPELCLLERSTDPTHSRRPSRPEPTRAARTQRSAGSTASASRPDASVCADALRLYGRDTEEQNRGETGSCKSRVILKWPWCPNDRWSDSEGRHTANSEDSTGLPWIKEKVDLKVLIYHGRSKMY